MKAQLFQHQRKLHVHNILAPVGQGVEGEPRLGNDSRRRNPSWKESQMSSNERTATAQQKPVRKSVLLERCQHFGLRPGLHGSKDGGPHFVMNRNFGNVPALVFDLYSESGRYWERKNWSLGENSRTISPK